MATDNLYNDISIFDAEYYLANNPLLAAALEEAGVSAQEHYYLHGAAESAEGGVDGEFRLPNAWFDIDFYRTTKPGLEDVPANELLAHFALHGSKELLAPNPAYADENGKLKVAELAAYLEANPEVKAAVAEMTGSEVGAELTPEQASIAAFHFFTYGIEEGLSGGIADIKPVNPIVPDETDSLTEALNEYQEALDTQATALNAEQDVAAAAVDALELDIEADSETELFNIGAVTEAVDELVNAREQAVRDSTETTVIGQDEEINDESIALANQILADLETVAQKQVNSFKAKNETVVNLQEKIAAYNAVAEEISETANDFQGAAAKFAALNLGIEIGDSLLNGADAADDITTHVGPFALSFDENGQLEITGPETSNDVKYVQYTNVSDAESTKVLVNLGIEGDANADGYFVNPYKVGGKYVELSGGQTDNQNDGDIEGFDGNIKAVALLSPDVFTEDGTYVLGVFEGKSAEGEFVKNIIINVKTVDGVKEFTSTEAGLEEAFNSLKGSQEFVEAFEALYANIAKEESAAKAVDTATLNALKAAGYQVYAKDSAADAQAVSWNNVKIEDGKLVAADAEKSNFELKAKKADGSFDVVSLDSNTLVDLNGIDSGTGAIADGSVIGVNMPSSIVSAAEDSQAAVAALEAAKADIKAFNKALDEYNAAVEAQSELKDAAADVTAAAEAVAEAEEAFDDLGFNLVKAVAGIANGTAFDENAEDQDADLFVYGENKLTVENFDGSDKLYFGDKAADLITITKAQAESAAGKVGGEDNVLDIFAYQDGANTILLVEKEVFAGNASGAATDNPDLVEVTLTGVNVADLSFEDGFLAFA